MQPTSLAVTLAACAPIAPALTLAADTRSVRQQRRGGLPIQILIDIGVGVLAGVITWVVLDRAAAARRNMAARKFREVFGSDVVTERRLHLVFAEFALAMFPKHAETGTVLRHVYVKPGDVSPGESFSIERPVSSCELRAVRYVTGAIGRWAAATPALSSDLDVRDKLDLSFVAFGGPGSNLKTRDAIQNSANGLVNFDGRSFTRQDTGEELVEVRPGFDYGMILKVNPKQFPSRTWIACAGIGEWGTSGAAWYLASKWQEIHQWAHSSPFLVIVAVKPTQDESAQSILRHALW